MISYGYYGEGMCRSCRTPNHLFVSSIEEQGIRCADCMGRYNDFPVPLDLFPIVTESALCQACERPEHFADSMAPEHTNQNWAFVKGLLSDGREVVVHRDCSTDAHFISGCESCKCNYATPRHRVYGHRYRSVNGSEFASFQQIEGNNYCGSCADTFYAENGGEENFNSCEACEDITSDTSEWSGSTYCQNCIDNNVYTCNDCGIEYWDGSGHNCPEDDDDCEDESSIHSYSYRPTPYFFGKGQYHLGFELEVEARNTSRYEGAGMVQDILGSHAYMKDDGSLNDGFEVVTHPHTLSNYQTDFNWDFISTLKREGFRSWNTETCGLHVHVSRTAFGTGESPWGRADRDALILKRQAHELRFMKLIYDNQRQVERISGRSNNHYATFQDKGHLVAKVKYGNAENGRYSAINTENDDTLEVRVFKGSLRKERVLSALEFVTASVEYTRDLKITSKNQALSWLRFTAYISDNLETYPNLALIMSESFASDATPNEN